MLTPRQCAEIVSAQELVTVEPLRKSQTGWETSEVFEEVANGFVSTASGGLSSERDLAEFAGLKFLYVWLSESSILKREGVTDRFL